MLTAIRFIREQAFFCYRTLLRTYILPLFLCMMSDHIAVEHKAEKRQYKHNLYCYLVKMSVFRWFILKSIPHNLSLIVISIIYSQLLSHHETLRDSYFLTHTSNSHET